MPCIAYTVHCSDTLNHEAELTARCLYITFLSDVHSHVRAEEKVHLLRSLQLFDTIHIAVR